MPSHTGQDLIGPYVQWGNQTKYYFNPHSVRSFNRASNMAHKQGVAI